MKIAAIQRRRLARVDAPAVGPVTTTSARLTRASIGQRHCRDRRWSPCTVSIAAQRDEPLDSRPGSRGVEGTACAIGGSSAGTFEWRRTHARRAQGCVGEAGYPGVGPGFAAARAQLQVGAGGAGFLDLAVDEVRPELALDVSALPRRMRIVAVGFEAGLRFVPVERVSWTLATLRVTIHY